MCVSLILLDWIHSVDGGFEVDIIYLAFDSVYPIIDYYISLKVMVYLVISCCG